MCSPKSRRSRSTKLIICPFETLVSDHACPCVRARSCARARVAHRIKWHFVSFPFRSFHHQQNKDYRGDCKSSLLEAARGSSFLCLCDDIDDDDGQVDSLIFVWRASYKESILYQGGNFRDKGLQPLRLFIISL